MMFSIVRPPEFVKKYYNNFTWSLPAENNEIYLTFDDGPVPGPTEFVLDQLQYYGAKGTFFCVGNNVQKHPLLFERIIKEGHRTGNHTFNHLNGWMSSAATYLNEVDRAGELINSDLFRPPYGRIRQLQSEAILKNYRIIMWDVLSYDFSQAVSPEKCLDNVIAHTRPGSIIVFHDSIKAFPNLQYALPKCLEYFKKEGFSFSSIL